MLRDLTSLEQRESLARRRNVMSVSSDVLKYFTGPHSELPHRGTGDRHLSISSTTWLQPIWIATGARRESWLVHAAVANGHWKRFDGVADKLKRSSLQVCFDAGSCSLTTLHIFVLWLYTGWIEHPDSNNHVSTYSALFEDAEQLNCAEFRTAIVHKAAALFKNVNCLDPNEGCGTHSRRFLLAVSDRRAKITEGKCDWESNPVLRSPPASGSRSCHYEAHVLCIVGPAKLKFYVHKDIFCRESRVFEKHFNGSFLHHHDKIDLSPESLKDFSLLVNWMYTGIIPVPSFEDQRAFLRYEAAVASIQGTTLEHNFSSGFDPSSEKEWAQLSLANVCKCDRERSRDILVSLYKYADFLDVPRLRNDIIDFLQALSDESPTATPKRVGMIFECLGATDHLRSWLASETAGFEAFCTDDMPAEFQKLVQDYNRDAAIQRSLGNPIQWTRHTCRFHCHSTQEDQAKCSEMDGAERHKKVVWGLGNTDRGPKLVSGKLVVLPFMGWTPWRDGATVVG